MWFIFALFTMIAWGTADLFYKRGADPDDRYSALKTAVFVGFAMGIYATCLILFGGVDFHPVNLLCYLPVSAMYILSMVVGYFGLRYLDLSVSSPLQNASGAVVALLCLIVLGQVPDLVTGGGILLVSVGVILLGVYEKQSEDLYLLAEGEKKYRIGFLAFFLPILYCVLDAFGTFLDAYYLDDIETTPLRHVTEENFEDVANIAYMYTFFIVAVILAVYLYGIKREKFLLPRQRDRVFAALAETAGQITYVRVIGGNAVVAAPMIGAYCVVSLILSRIFLKEKLSRKQIIAIALVIFGIVLFGVVEGLGE